MSTPSQARSLFIVALLALAMPGSGLSVSAQSLPSLFESGRPGARPTERPVRPHQARKAKLRLEALNVPAFRLNLFDNADRIAYRTGVDDHGNGRYSWLGTTDDGGIVSFAVVDGVTTGTVYLDGRSFEITPDADGEHTIEELNAAAFPTEEGPDGALEADMAADASGDGTVSAMAASDTLTEIGVMVLWTPAARSAAGGQANIESLILAAVNNANLAYTNSLVNARLKLVYSAEVAFTETPSNMSGDLSALRGTTDGKVDGIHSLRDQYGADIVSLIGNGYAGAGYCGLGYLMSSPSTSFASNAFNIVDRTCAAGYLSFAHEVGHNQGLHHDPSNAGSTPSYNYAYGYQDPGGAFRTVLSYGGATRVPYLSSPSVLYNGRVTGTSSQDNARALNNTAATVAAFKGGSASTTPTCSYSVSPTSLSFQSDAASATVSVTTTAGCSWTSSGSSWASVSGSGSGSGDATVSVTSNAGASRSATITVAGKSVSVSQAAAPAPATSCTYTVTPTSLSFTSSGGTATVTVSTTTGCSWTSSGSTSWATVSGSGSGSGTATVTVISTNGGSRSGSVTVAGQSVGISQSGAQKGGKKNGDGSGTTSPGGGNRK